MSTSVNLKINAKSIFPWRRKSHQLTVNDSRPVNTISHPILSFVLDGEPVIEQNPFKNDDLKGMSFQTAKKTVVLDCSRMQILRSLGYSTFGELVESLTDDCRASNLPNWFENA